jgi:hypothetical protein
MTKSQTAQHKNVEKEAAPKRKEYGRNVELVRVMRNSARSVRVDIPTFTKALALLLPPGTLDLNSVKRMLVEEEEIEEHVVEQTKERLAALERK